MTRLGLILPLFFLVASGCSLCDCQKVATETPATSVPVVKSEPAPSVEIVESKVVEPPTVTTRALTHDDVRGLQRRLHDIGFNPGPVDGIVGPRTKATYVRLHTACTEVSPLLENLNLSAAEGQSSVGKPAPDEIPNREETKKVQFQLRHAGFNPGPVDGIFGNRTQSALRQFQSGCLMAKEFESMLDDSLLAVVTETADAQAPKALTSSSRSDAADGAGRATVVQPARAREKIRILQLRLRDAGFDPGPFDGIMGPKTKSALAQYEASQRSQQIKPSLTTSGVMQY
ncbi:MAG TPA: peptidoglycan-binding domain-containing protein [Candidatus Binatia bacterium]|nr:peptidoglycan-binding domain-containing protein [Candidatus Binatia bacterium]